MSKYGLEFEAVAERSGWFTAHGVRRETAEQAAERVHAECELGSDLVFCGLGPATLTAIDCT
jgi:hypothetical protein